MGNPEVNVRPLIMSQAEGSFRILPPLHRIAMLIWIGMFIFIFAVVENWSIEARHVQTAYIVVASIAGVHVLMLLLVVFRIGGPPSQPGLLSCTDEGLQMQYCNARGAWGRTKLIPWSDIRGAMSGGFQDVSRARARVDMAAGSGAMVGVKTYHVGLVLFLGDREVKRQVWIVTSHLRSLTRTDMDAALEGLSEVSTEIERRVAAAGTALDEATRKKLLSDQKITPLDQPKGFSPRSDSYTPPRVGVKEVGLLLSFVLISTVLVEISRPRMGVLGLERMVRNAVSDTDDGLVMGRLAVSVRDFESFMINNTTEVQMSLLNTENRPIRIDDVVVHGYLGSVSIQEHVAAEVLRPGEIVTVNTEVALPFTRWLFPVVVHGVPLEQ